MRPRAAFGRCIRTRSKPYLYVMAIAMRQFGRVEAILNFENLLNVRQTDTGDKDRQSVAQPHSRQPGTSDYPHARGKTARTRIDEEAGQVLALYLSRSASGSVIEADNASPYLNRDVCQ